MFGTHLFFRGENIKIQYISEKYSADKYINDIDDKYINDIAIISNILFFIDLMIFYNSQSTFYSIRLFWIIQEKGLVEFWAIKVNTPKLN